MLTTDSTLLYRYRFTTFTTTTCYDPSGVKLNYPLLIHQRKSYRLTEVLISPEFLYVRVWGFEVATDLLSGHHAAEI